MSQPIQKVEIGLLKLLNDKHFDLMTITIIAAVLTTLVPTWQPYEWFVLLLLFSAFVLLSIILHLKTNFGSGDIGTILGNPPTTVNIALLMQWIQTLVTTLNSTTSAMNAHTAALNANIQATNAARGLTVQSVPLASVFPPSDQVVG